MYKIGINLFKIVINLIKIVINLLKIVIKFGPNCFLSAVSRGANCGRTGKYFRDGTPHNNCLKLPSCLSSNSSVEFSSQSDITRNTDKLLSSPCIKERR